MIWIRASENAVTSSFCSDENITDGHLVRTLGYLTRWVSLKRHTKSKVDRNFVSGVCVQYRQSMGLAQAQQELTRQWQVTFCIL